MTSLRAKIGGSSEPKEAVALAESESKPPAPEAVASLPPQEPLAKDPLAKDPLAEYPLSRSESSVILFAGTLAMFWSGAALAFLWGYYGIQGLVALPPHLIAFATAATFIPSLLFVACAFAFNKAQAMSNAASALRAAAEKLTHVDDSVIGSITDEAQGFKTFITGSLPSAGLAALGLFAGFKRK